MIGDDGLVHNAFASFEGKFISVGGLSYVEASAYLRTVDSIQATSKSCVLPGNWRFISELFDQYKLMWVLSPVVVKVIQGVEFVSLDSLKSANQATRELIIEELALGYPEASRHAESYFLVPLEAVLSSFAGVTPIEVNL